MASLPRFDLADIDWDYPSGTAAFSASTTDSRPVLPHSTDTRDRHCASPRHSRLHTVFWRTAQEWAVLKEVSLDPEEPPREFPSERIARVARIMGAPADVPVIRYLAAHVDDAHHYSWLLAPCVGGSLRDLLYRQAAPCGCGLPPRTGGAGLPESLCVTIGRQVLNALCYLHEKARVLHGDLSTSNVLLAATLTANGVCAAESVAVRVADFDDTCDLDAVLSRPTGAIVYRPPEWCRPTRDEAPATTEAAPVWIATAAVDVWSFGVLLTHILTGKLHPCLPKVGLFSAEADTSVWALLATLGADSPTVQRVAGVEPSASRKDWLDLSPLRVSPAASEVLHACLAWSPDDRPSAAQLLQMPWFRD